MKSAKRKLNKLKRCRNNRQGERKSIFPILGPSPTPPRVPEALQTPPCQVRRGPYAWESPDPTGDENLPRAQRAPPTDRREENRGVDGRPQGQTLPTCRPRRGARPDSAQRAPSGSRHRGPRRGDGREHDGKEKPQKARGFRPWG